jgi:hypothetical protein
LQAAPLGEKAAVRRPGANEGEREEEEKRPGISTRRPGRPHGSKSVIVQALKHAEREGKNAEPLESSEPWPAQT